LTHAHAPPILLAVGHGRYSAAFIAFQVLFFVASASWSRAAVADTVHEPGKWLAGHPPDARAMESDFETRFSALRAFGSRIEGSREERSASEWIAGAIRSAGFEPSIDPLDDLSDAQSDSMAVSLAVSGTSGSLLTFIVPLDTHVDGPADEGDAAIALMLAELDRLGRLIAIAGEPPIGVGVVFLPADARGSVSEGRFEGPGPGWWLSRMDTANPNAVVYLSLDSPPGAMDLRNSERDLLSPWWLFDRARSALSSSGFRFNVHPNEMQAHRLGLLTEAGPLAPFLENGIPAVELRGIEGMEVSPTPALSFSRLFEALIDADAGGFPNEWDRNYSSFELGGLEMEIREGPYMVFLLFFSGCVAVLVLFLSLRRRATIPRLLVKLPHRLLNLGLLALISALAVLLSFACLGLEYLLLGSTSAWKIHPALFAIARIGMSGFAFFGFLSFSVPRRWISPDPWFYEVVALVLFGVDIFVFAFLSLPLSLYFCWGFAVVLASTIVRRKMASLVAAALSVLPLLLVASEMFTSSMPSTLGFLVAPDPTKGLFLTLVVLPFATMLASPLFFLAPKGIRKRRTAVRVFFLFSIVAELIPVAVTFVGSATVPINLRESFDQSDSSWKANIESDVRISALTLARNGVPVSLRSEAGRAEVEGADASAPISAIFRSKAFLDRENRFIEITFPREPVSTSLRLVSGRPLAIYDCSLPYRVDLDGLDADILVGPGKGSRLAFTLTTDTGLDAMLNVKADFPGGLAEWRSKGKRPLHVVDCIVDAAFKLGVSSR